jgi:hypothetical protein
MTLSPEAQRTFLGMHRQLDTRAFGDRLPDRLRKIIETLAERDTLHPDAGETTLPSPGTGSTPDAR